MSSYDSHSSVMAVVLRDNTVIGTFTQSSYVEDWLLVAAANDTGSCRFANHRKFSLEKEAKNKASNEGLLRIGQQDEWLGSEREYCSDVSEIHMWPYTTFKLADKDSFTAIAYIPTWAPCIHGPERRLLLF